jgi:hypothetical protein
MNDNTKTFGRVGELMTQFEAAEPETVFAMRIVADLRAPTRRADMAF